MFELKNILEKGGLSRLFCFLGILVLVSCNSLNIEEERNEVYNGRTMGTKYNIVFAQHPVTSQKEVDSVLRFVNEVFSTYDSTSYISSINHPEVLEHYINRFPLEIRKQHNAEFQRLMKMSYVVYTNTQGVFDPSAATLFNLWGFGESNKSNPTDEEISFALTSVGFEKYKKLVFSEKNQAIEIDDEINLNFNAIAKGYGTDKVAELLLKNGDSSFMVEIGGEVRTSGHSPSNEKWIIGVNIPESGSSQQSVLDTVQLSDMSIATSGNYRNFYYDSIGNIIGHTIDPRTGYPVINELKSATVFHKSCAMADAYATAAMVLGVEKFKNIIVKDTNLEALLVFQKGDSIIRERVYD